MTQWMADETKSKVDWSEQKLEPPNHTEPLVAPCLWGVKQQPESPTETPTQPKHTTSHSYINQGGGVQFENLDSLHTTPPSDIKPEGGVLQKNHDQEPVDLSELMKMESLQPIADDLRIVATIEDSEGMEMLKDIRDWMPPEALKAAANLLPKPLWARIAEMVSLQDFPVENQHLEKAIAVGEQPATSTQELPTWKGLSLRIKEGLEVVGSVCGGLYRELSEKFGQAIGIAENEPLFNTYLQDWQVHVVFADGLKSIPCSWLEIAIS